MTRNNIINRRRLIVTAPCLTFNTDVLTTGFYAVEYWSESMTLWTCRQNICFCDFMTFPVLTVEHRFLSLSRYFFFPLWIFFFFLILPTTRELTYSFEYVFYCALLWHCSSDSCLFFFVFVVVVILFSLDLIGKLKNLLIQLQCIQFRIKLQMFTKHLVRLPDGEMDANKCVQWDLLYRRLCVHFSQIMIIFISDGALFFVLMP